MSGVKLEKVAHHPKMVIYGSENRGERDVGTLTVTGDKIEFVGSKRPLTINNIQFIRKQWKWLIVEYLDEYGKLKNLLFCRYPKRHCGR